MRDVAEEFERLEGRKDYIVLFEEPELFLYPKVVKELRDLIYEVSDRDTPYQVLCASHSPAMIDISRLKSSIVRMVKTSDGTKIYQVTDSFLKDVSGVTEDEAFKQEMYEVLRFNPYVCEAFYADEVILVEGPTEEIVLRAYLQAFPSSNFYFILNCGTVTNIPFYQRVLTKFSISYNIICDTDASEIDTTDDDGNPSFKSGIQKAISDQFTQDRAAGNSGKLRCHQTTFEPAHRAESVAEALRLPEASDQGKPFDANRYWKDVLLPNLGKPAIETVPIIGFMKEIVAD